MNLDQSLFLENTQDPKEAKDKEMIRFSAQLWDMTKRTIRDHLNRRVNDVAKNLAERAHQTLMGTSSDGSTAKTIEEWPLSPAPMKFKGENRRLGYIAIAFQYPEKDKLPKYPGKVPQEGSKEYEKFIRERTNFFGKFIRELILTDETLDNLSTETTLLLYRQIIEGRDLASDRAKVLWRGKITVSDGKESLGRVLVTYKVDPRKDD